MPTIYNLKPRFQALLRPICRSLYDKGITANQVTIAALLLSVLGGILVIVAEHINIIFISIPIILLIRMALNAIDGMLAREHDMQSSTGAILNELGDVISDAVLYLPFAVLPGINNWFVIILVILAILVEMTGVIAVQIGASRRYDGPFGKSDRAFLFGFIGLILATGIAPDMWFDGLVILAIILSCITIKNRAGKALEELS